MDQEVLAVLRRIAKALESQAEAIELLARATAGEFDEGDEERLPRSLGDRDLPDDHPSFRDGSAWGVQKAEVEPGESRAGNG